MFKKILFATSATEACDHAARVAFDIAQRYNAHIDVFHVLGIPPRGFSQIVVDVTTGDEVILDDNYRDLVKEEIRTYYDHQIEKTENWSIDVAIGLPHREILRIARNIKPDIIVMGGSTGASGSYAAKKIVTGSTFQRVAKAARCPVMVINRPAASFWGGFSNVVFGTDFSDAADSAFAFALALVKELNCEFHIFHALDITRFQINNFHTQDYIEDQIRKAGQQLRFKYASKMKAFRQYNMAVWEGIPFVEIVKYAREKQADLIVMAHNTRKTEDGEASIGSVAEQVVLRANCPVISINRSAGKKQQSIPLADQ
ncbi:MAG: universal stress protein [Desulfobacteraceae bacterium]|jgi:nucleotide-binding universal stress UspA family protein|nr:universal stress protein [Desulfobacteraceae bacterium]